MVNKCKHKKAVWQKLPKSECIWGLTQGLICPECNAIIARTSAVYRKSDCVSGLFCGGK